LARLDESIAAFNQRFIFPLPFAMKIIKINLWNQGSKEHARVYGNSGKNFFRVYKQSLTENQGSKEHARVYGNSGKNFFRVYKQSLTEGIYI
jgi:hypothetical protein